MLPPAGASTYEPLLPSKKIVVAWMSDPAKDVFAVAERVIG
jgi:hypothetical protein